MLGFGGNTDEWGYYSIMPPIEIDGLAEANVMDEDFIFWDDWEDVYDLSDGEETMDEEE